MYDSAFYLENTNSLAQFVQSALGSTQAKRIYLFELQTTDPNRSNKPYKARAWKSAAAAQKIEFSR